MHRPKSLLLLLALALLLAGMPAAAPARAAAPTVYRGRITYMERGPAASVYGLGTTLLLAAAMPVAVGRVLNLLRKAIEVLSQLPRFKEEPSLQTMDEWMNEGIPVDLAKAFPIAGAYDATIDFTLQEAGDGTFHLQSGTVQWKTSNGLELSAEGTTLHDSFSGAGSYTLDPAKDKIDLRIDHASDPPTFALDVEISHPEPVSGESKWAGPEGTFEITLKADKGEMVMDGLALGIPLAAAGMPSPMTITEADDPQTRLVEFGQRGSLDKLGDGIETWRDTFDNQVLVEYGIGATCEARIVEPERSGVLTYDGSAKGVLEAQARADTEPPSAHDSLEHLVWTFPEIPGSTLAVDPQDRHGAEVTFRYQGLPAQNSQLGEKEIRAAYEPGAACDDPPPQPVRVFFSREAKNNPGGTVPNWFYYWMQTGASQGHGDAIVYSEDDRCTLDGKSAAGYWDPADPDRIHICNLGPSFGGTNMVTGGEQRGIDYFAGIVRHEWTHLENDRDWWGESGYDPDKDQDGDGVPDSREAAYGLNPRVADTLGIGLRDCEIPAYRAQDTWPIGSADAEDWANPGKQSGGA